MIYRVYTDGKPTDYQREGGHPECFNGNPLAAMDGPGPMGNAIELMHHQRS